jgi:hypothetical protein
MVIFCRSMLEVSWIAEQKLVPQEGLCSCELGQTFISDVLRTPSHKEAYSVRHRPARCNSTASKQSPTWPHCSTHPILLSTWRMCAACLWKDGAEGVCEGYCIVSVYMSWHANVRSKQTAASLPIWSSPQWRLLSSVTFSRQALQAASPKVSSRKSYAAT